MSLSLHTMVLKEDDTVYFTGRNYYGQSGLGGSADRTDFQEVSNMGTDTKMIACGENHTLILKKDGTVWGVGHNSSGNLGVGDTSVKRTLTQCKDILDASFIACGYLSSGLVKSDGTLWMTGINTSGVLGLGVTGSGGNKNVFTHVDYLSDIKGVAIGQYHSMAVTLKGVLYSCGENGSGQLGRGDTVDINTFQEVTSLSQEVVKSVYCGNDHTIVLTGKGELYASGLNSSGQLGLGDKTNRTSFEKVPNMNNVKEVSCGHSHTVVLKKDGTVWVAGLNTGYELGLGDTNERVSFEQIPAISDIINVSCGKNHTVLLKDDGSVLVFGKNTYGECGDSTTVSVQTPKDVAMNNVKALWSSFASNVKPHIADGLNAVLTYDIDHTFTLGLDESASTVVDFAIKKGADTLIDLKQTDAVGKKLQVTFKLDKSKVTLNTLNEFTATITDSTGETNDIIFSAFCTDENVALCEKSVLFKDLTVPNGATGIIISADNEGSFIDCLCKKSDGSYVHVPFEKIISINSTNTIGVKLLLSKDSTLTAYGVGWVSTKPITYGIAKCTL